MNILTLYYICYVILAIYMLDSGQEPSYNVSKNLLLLPRILKLMKDMVDDSTPLIYASFSFWLICFPSFHFLLYLLIHNWLCMYAAWKRYLLVWMWTGHLRDTSGGQDLYECPFNHFPFGRCTNLSIHNVLQDDTQHWKQWSDQPWYYACCCALNFSTIGALLHSWH